MADKTLVCKDCGADFVFTDCRKARKAARRNFNQN